MEKLITPSNEDGKINIGEIKADKAVIAEHVDINFSRQDKQKPQQGPKQPPSIFVGRSQALDDLVNLLALEGANPGVVVVKGMGGVGKTTLMRALKHDTRIQRVLADGVLWGSLGPRPDPEHIVNVWGAALGMDLRAYKSLDERLNYLSSLIASDKILIILDDVWSAEHVRPLLIGGADSRTVITTRNNEVPRDLASHQILGLKPLDQAASIELLDTYSPGMFQNDLNSVINLVEELGGLPLALTLVGGVFKSSLDANINISLLLEELHKRTARLSVDGAEQRPGLSPAETSLEAVLRLSYDYLPDDAARRAFRFLGAFGGGSLHFSLEAAGTLWEANQLQAQKLMALLVSRNLVEPIQSRFALHSLLADFAISLLSQEETQKAVDTHAHYFLDIAKKYKSMEDWSSLDLDWKSLRLVADRMSSQNANLAAIQSADLIADYFSAFNFVIKIRKPPGSKGWLLAGVEACRLLNRRADEGWLLLTLGQFAIDDGELDKAREIFMSSSQVFSQADERRGQLYAQGNLGVIHQIRGEYEEAITCFRHVVTISEGNGDYSSAAIGHYNIGDILDKQGHKEQAFAEFVNSRNYAKRLSTDGKDTLARVDCRLAGLQANLGMLDHALKSCEEADEIAKELKSPPLLERVQAAWAIYWEAIGENDKADTCFKESIEICRSANLTEELAETLEAYGCYLLNRNHTEEGCKQLVAAGEIFRKLGADERLSRLESRLRTIRAEE